MDLEGQIADIFESELGIPRDEVRADLAYGSVPEWDSASHMVVVMAIEERFGIEFDSDEIVELSSVGAIVDTLRAKGVAASADG